MLFTNKKGEICELADNLTLQELVEMGIDISLVEHDVIEKHEVDEQEDIWMHTA